MLFGKYCFYINGSFGSISIKKVQINKDLSNIHCLLFFQKMYLITNYFSTNNIIIILLIKYKNYFQLGD